MSLHLSCLFLASIIILLLFRISGDVYPNPDPVFSCSVCAENVTSRGRLVQCSTCSKWVHLRCSLHSSSKFNALGSSHSWSCPPCHVTASSGGPQPSNPVTSSLGSQNVYLHCSICFFWPPLPMQRPHTTLANKHFIFLLPISYLCAFPILICSYVSSCSSTPPPPSSSPESLRFLQ